jgi:hypothetical protein
MNIELADMLCDVCDNYGIESYVMNDYSGRGMYGKETAGLVVASVSGFMWAMAKALTEGYEYLLDDVPDVSGGWFKMDSMGKDNTVIY